ncbi:MAG: hypothetical protein WD315_00070 [Balneolaceae bacterium]
MQQKRLFVLLLTLLLSLAMHSGIALAQSSDSSPIPNVYLDCQRCDFNYIRTNIDFVNYVRDQDDADIYLRITDLRTAGGREYTLQFRGTGTFTTQSDTLTYRSRDTDSNDEERSGLARYIKIGLVPFASQTTAIENLNVFYTAPTEDETPEVIDPWNGWVFDINLRTWLNGEDTEQNFGLHTGFWAERITDRLKIEGRVRGDLSRRRLDLTDGTVNVNRDWGEYRGLVAWSLTDHVALGLYSRVNFSRTNNIKLNIESSPAIEFNYFPYGEYQERRIVLRYRVTPSYQSYFSETVFEKFSENLLHQSLNTQVRYDQPWGRIDVSVNASNYFHDTAINRLEFWPSLNIRIIRGLSVNLSGRYRIINDQITQPLGDITDEERLTGQIQQPTSFDYRISFGLTYTFGSIYNTVVNPVF